MDSHQSQNGSDSKKWAPAFAGVTVPAVTFAGMTVRAVTFAGMTVRAITFEGMTVRAITFAGMTVERGHVRRDDDAAPSLPRNGD